MLGCILPFTVLLLACHAADTHATEEGEGAGGQGGSGGGSSMLEGGGGQSWESIHRKGVLTRFTYIKCGEHFPACPEGQTCSDPVHGWCE